MPFAGYKDFDDCVKKNKDKKDPEAYCASIQNDAEKGRAPLLDFRARSGRARQPWTWDAQLGRYRDARGELLDSADVRELSGVYLEAMRQRAAGLADQLTAGEVTLPEWENDMRRLLKDAFGGSYMLGRGGRNVMTAADWGRLGNQVRYQYGKLNEFAGQMAAGSVTEGRVAARAMLYPLAGKQAFSRGAVTAAGDPDLPAYPGDGTTECYSNCGCYWQLEETKLGDGGAGWNATWIRGKEDSCRDCLRREFEWAPLVVRAKQEVALA